MPTVIHKDDVRRLVAGVAVLVDVLPSKDYEEEHLPGAISIALTNLTRETTAQLPLDRPVIVYCADDQ
ncbi:MAG: rhodanese-like domain-containing protein [Acidobacteria bacterium]|nr:rhodanese-like domain-containing protein [Acidobacteriota bacterium]